MKPQQTSAPAAPPLFPGQDARDVLLTRPEVAVYLKTSIPTLELWAQRGEGPAITRVGRGVRYRLSDVRSFVERGGDAAARSLRRTR